MFKFITRQHFIVNLLVAIVLLVGLMFLFLWMLGFITNHNAYDTIPTVVGKQLKEATKSLEDKGFRVEVQDSLWDDQLAPLTVIRQSPEGNHLVKANRRVYLTINRSQPPLLDMPNLVGLSFRNAEVFLTQMGLVVGDTTRKLDIAKDAILEQLFDGKPITPGTKVFYGSKISLVLGNGLSDEEQEVPDLFGMTYSEAKNMLGGMGLQIGAMLIDAGIKDTAQAFIYRQEPEFMTLRQDGTTQINKIRQGQSLDVWLSPLRKERETVVPPETPTGY